MSILGEYPITHRFAVGVEVGSSRLGGGDENMSNHGLLGDRIGKGEGWHVH